MPIRVIIQDRNHGEVASYADDLEGTFSGLRAVAPPGSLLKSIDPYGDTLFNLYQLEFLIAEIDAMPVRSASEQSIWNELRNAAHLAIRNRGYLSFIGD